MALYAALTFWLLVIMFSAWGVHRLWSALIKPRVVNSVLLPGTLVAQLGHVLGLLLSGNAIRNTSLMSEGEEGEPETDTPEKQGIPILGPILVGLLPLVACAICLYVVAALWGGNVIDKVGGGSAQLPQALPTSLDGIWDLLRHSVSLMEATLDAILRSNLFNWPRNLPTLLFLYLAVCLTVRMAPFEGCQRGAVGAILLAAIVIAVVSYFVPAAQSFVEDSSWPILSFAVGMLLFLLLLTLLIHGVIGLIRILAKNR